jgi:hypothetical protein
VSGIGRRDSLGRALGACGADLVERDLRLGLEHDVLRHAGFRAPRRVGGPFLGEIEPKGDRQVRLLVGCRERDGDLAIVLFAELAAVLRRHADGMDALIGKPGVVDDPDAHASALFDRRENEARHLPQQRFVRPFGVGDEMMQRLIRRLNAPRLHPRRHRFDALAIAGKNETGAVGTEWRRPICVSKDAGDALAGA